MTSNVSASAEGEAPVADRPLVVAIDGPAASGKSSTAKWVAAELGISHVDSGSQYRAATAARLRRGGEPAQWTEREVLDAAADVTFVPEARSMSPRLRGDPVDEELRGAAVTAAVSLVAKMPGVRDWVNTCVREAADRLPVVVDGRDMGTAVFPEAQLKIFLIADPWERARRRLIQRLERRPTDDEIAAETEALVRRDAKDEAQTQRAPDAVLMDTTFLTQQEQVERIVALARSVTAGGR
ncbi:MAG: (d)CMP kinase [Gemmatimonadaceae bacterium]